jgi:excinuclease ABC subunit A
MGPEGGEGGGRIVAQGPPEAIARCPQSHTGQFLARYFHSPGVASTHLPPVVLPDLEKKPPRPKFIKPEKKTGVPTASKVKPESKRAKTKARVV